MYNKNNTAAARAAFIRVFGWQFLPVCVELDADEAAALKFVGMRWHVKSLERKGYRAGIVCMTSREILTALTFAREEAEVRDETSAEMWDSVRRRWLDKLIKKLELVREVAAF